MLDRSEAVTKLILDEKWQGSSAVCSPSCSPSSTLSELTMLCRSDVNQDEEILRNQLLEREAARRREAEAREREAELARQRLEEERLAREEEERRQAERGKALEKKRGVGRGVSRTVDPSSSGVRGVRGTRASMRARGVATGIARGTADSSFNSRDGVLICYFKARLPERAISLGLLRQHPVERV